MNAAWCRRVSLIIAPGLPAIPSPTINVLTGDRPAASGFCPPRPTSSYPRRLVHSRRPNRVHLSPYVETLLRTGPSRSVAPHPALLRRSYGSIPHDSSPHRNGLAPFYPVAFSGARGLGVLAGPNLIEVNQLLWRSFAVIHSFGMATVRVLYASLFQAFRWGRRGLQPSQLNLCSSKRPRLDI
jgi:hypothetical protein